MSCQSCDSDRIANVQGKCSDMCHVTLGEEEHDGYVPGDFGIGSGDYIEIEYCLDCGQIQGEFPLLPTSLENEDE